MTDPRRKLEPVVIEGQAQAVEHSPVVERT
jgi:hypothetical protein